LGFGCLSRALASRIVNKTHLTALATAVLIAISGASAGVAEAAPFGPSSPLSPVSQQNAVRKAQQYLEMSAYSRQGLITQLVEGEQFSTDDATYAVDSLNADWNQQAAKKARQYLEMTAYSHGGLLNQLIDGEHFTPSQAAYGVNAVGSDTLGCEFKGF
jgi:Host cell surface-exposed lipoprotein